jgi:hypothetical protein
MGPPDFLWSSPLTPRRRPVVPQTRAHRAHATSDFVIRNSSRLARFEATLGLFQALPYLGSLEQSIHFVANRIVRVSCHGPSYPRFPPWR